MASAVLAIPDTNGETERMQVAKPPGGKDASKRMHDYLLNQKRRKEEYFLRKYGKVIQPSKGAASTTGSKDPQGLLTLPSLTSQPEGHHAAMAAGAAAPIFQAKGPISSFPHNASAVIDKAQHHALDKHHKLVDIPYHPVSVPSAPAHLPPLPSSREGSRRMSTPSDRAPSSPQAEDAGAELQHPTPSAALPLLQQQQQRHAQLQQQLHQQQQRLQQQGVVEGSLWKGGAHEASPFVSVRPELAYGGDSLHGFSPRSQAAYNLALQASHSKGPASQYTSRALSHGEGSGADVGKPRKGCMRDLQLELSVIKAIKAREEVVERLRVACLKVDTASGGHPLNVLNLADPLLKLFFRLVTQLRHRTLDVIEAIGAWHRRTASSEPFMYAGIGNYLAYIGTDLAFLDETPFVQHRLYSLKAVEDPFLTEVTPDGVPIDAASTVDLRRGGVRFTADGLRIRMARKILHLHGGHGHSPSSETPGEHSAANNQSLGPSEEVVDGQYPGDLQLHPPAGSMPPLKEESLVWGKEDSVVMSATGDAQQDELQQQQQHPERDPEQHQGKGQEEEEEQQQQHGTEGPEEGPTVQGQPGVVAYHLRAYSMELDTEDFEARQLREEEDRKLQELQELEKLAEFELQQQKLQEEWRMRDLKEQEERQILQEEEILEYQQQLQQQQEEQEGKNPAAEQQQQVQQEQDMQQQELEQSQKQSLHARQQQLAEHQVEQQKVEEEQAAAVAALAKRQQILAEVLVEVRRASGAETADVQQGKEGISGQGAGADDESVIDAAIDAMICSLQEPYCSQVQANGFTYEGWLFERKLDAVMSEMGSEPATPIERIEMHKQLLLEKQQPVSAAAHVTLPPGLPAKPTSPQWGVQVHLDLHTEGEQMQAELQPIDQPRSAQQLEGVLEPAPQQQQQAEDVHEGEHEEVLLKGHQQQPLQDGDGRRAEGQSSNQQKQEQPQQRQPEADSEIDQGGLHPADREQEPQGNGDGELQQAEGNAHGQSHHPSGLLQLGGQQQPEGTHEPKPDHEEEDTANTGVDLAEQHPGRHHQPLAGGEEGSDEGELHHQSHPQQGDEGVVGAVQQDPALPHPNGTQLSPKPMTPQVHLELLAEDNGPAMHVQLMPVNKADMQPVSAHHRAGPDSEQVIERV